VWLTPAACDPTKGAEAPVLYEISNLSFIFPYKLFDKALLTGATIAISVAHVNKKWRVCGMNVKNFNDVTKYLCSQVCLPDVGNRWHHGVHAKLEGDRIIFIAVGMTYVTEVAMLLGSSSNGKGEFFVSLDDFHNLASPLRWELAAPRNGKAEVKLQRGSQPHGKPSLHVAISDWFTAEIGVLHPYKDEHRSPQKTHGGISQANLREHARSIRALSDGDQNFKYREVGKNIYEVSLPTPGFGTLYVKRTIY
jgi:hypothetical protein